MSPAENYLAPGYVRTPGTGTPEYEFWNYFFSAIPRESGPGIKCGFKDEFISNILKGEDVDQDKVHENFWFFPDSGGQAHLRAIKAVLSMVKNDKIQMSKNKWSQMVKHTKAVLDNQNQKYPIILMSAENSHHKIVCDLWDELLLACAMKVNGDLEEKGGSRIELFFGFFILAMAVYIWYLYYPKDDNDKD